MDKAKLSKFVGKTRSITQSEINDVYIWVELSQKALSDKLGDEAFLETRVFPVPSHRPAKTVHRDADEVRDILTSAVDTKIFWSVLVYLVSRVESALGDILKEVLRADPRRLLIGGGTKKVDVRMVVECEGFSELIEKVILSNLHDVGYLRPSEQLEYFTKVVGIKIEPELSGLWFEIKATRDILVHSNGIANEIYEAKAGDLKRGSDGELLLMDSKYFTHCCKTMKRLVGRVCSRIQADLKPKRSKSKKPNKALQLTPDPP